MEDNKQTLNVVFTRDSFRSNRDNFRDKMQKAERGYYAWNKKKQEWVYVKLKDKED